MKIDINIREVKPLTCFGIEEGRYTIDNFGNIYSLMTNKYVRPFTDKDGYKRIELSIRKKVTKKFYVHRLVAATFVEGMSEENRIVNHKNGLKYDNFEYNLEWVTCSENDLHAFRKGLRHPTNVIYSDRMIHKICKLLEKGKSNKQILHAITGSDDIPANKEVYLLIWRLRSRENWKHITDQYSY